MKLRLCKEFLYRIKDGDDLETISSHFNTCKENILRNNNEIDFYAGEWVRIKTNDYQTYIVKPAESLKEIATKFSIDVEKIMADNKLQTDKVFIGQLLKIYK